MTCAYLRSLSHILLILFTKKNKENKISPVHNPISLLNKVGNFDKCILGFFIAFIQSFDVKTLKRRKIQKSFIKKILPYLTVKWRIEPFR